MKRWLIGLAIAAAIYAVLHVLVELEEKLRQYDWEMNQYLYGDV